MISIEGDVLVSTSIEIACPITLEGAGCGATMRAGRFLQHGRGLLVTKSRAVVSGIKFEGARNLTGNAAGLWHEGGSLKVKNCSFVSNQNGIMVAASAFDTVEVDGCSFVMNGAGCGHTHGIYVGRVRSLKATQNNFENTICGHDLKSRAAHTLVRDNYFHGGPGSTTSCAIDIPNAGEAVVARNLFVKGKSSFSRKFISYSAECNRHSVNSLDVSCNIFINHRRGLTIGIANYAPLVAARLSDTPTSGQPLDW